MSSYWANKGRVDIQADQQKHCGTKHTSQSQPKTIAEQSGY